MKDYIVKYKTNNDEHVEKDFNTYEQCLDYVYSLIEKVDVNIEKVQVYSSYNKFDTDSIKTTFALTQALYKLYRKEIELKSEVFAKLKPLTIDDFKSIVKCYEHSNYVLSIKEDTISVRFEIDDSIENFDMESFIKYVIEDILDCYWGLNGPQAMDDYTANVFLKLLPLSYNYCGNEKNKRFVLINLGDKKFIADYYKDSPIININEYEKIK